MSTFWARLSLTAAAMAGVISPHRALAVRMPMGPQMTSASRALTTTGFSPVAAASAPAFSMAAVAAELAPTAMI